MEEIQYQGSQWTWANNWTDEGFIEARLDRFFGSSQWLMSNGKAVVKYILKPASDHSLVEVDTNPDEGQKKKRFCFDKRWIGKPGVEDIIKHTWEQECVGSHMFQVASKIKRCRLELIEWSRGSQNNSAIRIQNLTVEMEELQQQDGQGDWRKWHLLKSQLDKAYSEEEEF